MIEEVAIDDELERLALAWRPRNRDWSPEDEERVRRYYRRLDTVALARLLGRTPGAVAQKARELGCSDPASPGPVEAARVGGES